MFQGTENCKVICFGFFCAMLLFKTFNKKQLKLRELLYVRKDCFKTFKKYILVETRVFVTNCCQRPKHRNSGKAETFSCFPLFVVLQNIFARMLSLQCMYTDIKISCLDFFQVVFHHFVMIHRNEYCKN